MAERLAALDLLVVGDVVLSETAALADVVLPVTQWAEEDGTMTNLEGRVLRRRRAVAAAAGVRTSLDVLADLARRLGAPAFAPIRARSSTSCAGPAPVAADYAGITYERLDAGEALFWPCPPTTTPARRGCSSTRFATPDGRARFVAVEHRRPVDDLDATRRCT